MHIMVDLETMGTRPSAPIVSIGAVWFDETKMHQEFYTTISLQSAVSAGAEIDPSTVSWWLSQEKAAQEALRLDEGENIKIALEAFSDYCGWHELEGVWGNGASFDNIILSESFSRSGVKRPWPFWNDRCFRTMKAMHPSVTIDRIGTHHNALDDAKTQAAHLQQIWREM